MKQRKSTRSAAILLAALLVCCGMAGCDLTHKAESTASQTEQATESLNAANDFMAAAEIAQTALDNADTDTKWDDSTPIITLSGNSASCADTGVSIDNGMVTITEGGTYVIRGTLSGSLTVNGDADFHLIFDGITITADNTAPFCVQDAKKVVITLADGSENTLTDPTQYTEFLDTEQTEPNAALFAKSDLTINGSGSLTVNGSCAHGIHCKDTLRIVSGTITVNAARDGIKGKDAVIIKDGMISVTAGEDGVRSDNTTDAQCGYISLEGGTITVTAQQDGFQSETCTAISDGTITVTSGGGTANAQAQGNDNFGMGRFPDRDSTQAQATDTETVSTKAIKAGTELLLRGGAITADSAEDALHANHTITIEGGTTTLAAGDDGIHADSLLNISGGTHCVSQSYEGLEAEVIRISGGTLSITADDDGINASDGSGSSQGGMGGFGAASATAAFEMTGGHLAVYAGGDGLDSNGTMTISGGTALVHGPTNDGNGALDSGSGVTVNGGLLIAAGSSGMAETPDSSSAQNCVSLGVDTQDGGTLVCIQNSNGEAILVFAPSKQFSNIVFSTNAFTEGETYTVLLGGTYSGGSEDGGLYTDGIYSGGTELTSFTISDTLTTAGSASAGGFGGMGDGHRQDRGDMPNNGGNRNDSTVSEMPEMPDGEIPEMPDDFEAPMRGGVPKGTMPTESET